MVAVMRSVTATARPAAAFAPLRAKIAPRRALRRVAATPENEVSTSDKVATSVEEAPAPVPPSPMGSGSNAVSIADLMAFSGKAPELINGRLAMLAFVAAAGAELASGESVLRQLGQEPTLIVLTAIIFAVASFVPLLQKKEPESVGPFTPSAEMLNGRAAMIGFACLLAFEAVSGSALL